MIDLVLYRCHIGSFDRGGVWGYSKSQGQDYSVLSPYSNYSTKFYCFDINTGCADVKIAQSKALYSKKFSSVIIHLSYFYLCYGLIINVKIS